MSLATYFVRLIIAITVFSASAIAGAAQETQQQEKILIVVSSLDKKTDGFDLKDQASLDFWTNPQHRNKLGQTIKLSAIDPSKYSAILLVGGHGPMWDFVNNTELNNIVRTMYEKNDVISAVCHGPAGLINVKLSNGESLIKGRRLTGFTAAEEVSRQYDKIVPFELEGALKKGGAKFEEAPIFENNVVVDGRLITGQNPASATALGDAVVKALQARTQRKVAL